MNSPGEISADRNLSTMVSHLQAHYSSVVMDIIENKEIYTHNHKIITHSLYISARKLFEENLQMIQLLKLDPIIFYELLQEATKKLVSWCLKERKSTSINREDIASPCVSLQIVGRLHQFPEFDSLDNSTVNEENSPMFNVSPTIPKSNDLNCFKIIKGMVVKMLPVKVYACQQTYVCCKCNSVCVVRSSNIISLKSQKPPTICNSASSDGCSSTKFALVSSSNVNLDETGQSHGVQVADELYVDYQEIKIQEQPSENNKNNRSIPRSMWAIIQYDHVDKCQPGDSVTLYGVVMPRYKKFNSIVVGERCVVELVLVVNNMTVNNEDHPNQISSTRSYDASASNRLTQYFINYWKFHFIKPLSGREVIISSFCPQLYGMFHMRLAVLLAIIGGVPLVDSNTGTRTRSESHILIVGDPGTGKSQILKWACKLVKRSVFTTGTGSTSAGLTASVGRDASGEYSLEAGALPLSDGGICCIDEFNCIKEKDLVCVHEAMEQQSISIAKAGVVAQMRTRSSIIAAANAKGGRYYNNQQSITENLGIASALLSRFDLILVIKDPYDDNDWNRQLSSYILEKATENFYQDFIEDDEEDYHNYQKTWTLNKLRNYVELVKSSTPIFSNESALVLKVYYKHRRDDIQNTVDASRTTLRLLESLIRLATAHAKLMMHKSISLMDSIVAIVLMEISLAQITPNYISILSENAINANHLHAYNNNVHDFLMCEASNVLQKLDLIQLTPLLLRQDEVLVEEDLIHKVNTCDMKDAHTQYYKTIPNLLSNEDSNELSLLNEILDGDDDYLLQEFCFTDDVLTNNINHAVNINTQKLTLNPELTDQWEDIDDDELFGDL